jgi:hypothetical protein
MFWASIAIVGTNLNAKEKENANSYGNFIVINDNAKSFGSTVKKKREKAETIIYIRKIIATANEKDMNRVFNMRINSIRKDMARILLSHCFKSLPIMIRGIKLKKMINRGTI